MQSALGSELQGTTPYPDQGQALGIGPVQDQIIKIVETHDELLRLSSPDGAYFLEFQDGTIAITTRSTSP